MWVSSRRHRHVKHDAGPGLALSSVGDADIGREKRKSSASYAHGDQTRQSVREIGCKWVQKEHTGQIIEVWAKMADASVGQGPDSVNGPQDEAAGEVAEDCEVTGVVLRCKVSIVIREIQV